MLSKRVLKLVAIKIFYIIINITIMTSIPEFFDIVKFILTYLVPLIGEIAFQCFIWPWSYYQINKQTN